MAVRYDSRFCAPIPIYEIAQSFRVDPSEHGELILLICYGHDCGQTDLESQFA